MPKFCKRSEIQPASDLKSQLFEVVPISANRFGVATLPALYRAQDQENREIPFSELKITLLGPI